MRARTDATPLFEMRPLGRHFSFSRDRDTIHTKATAGRNGVVGGRLSDCGLLDGDRAVATAACGAPGFVVVAGDPLCSAVVAVGSPGSDYVTFGKCRRGSRQRRSIPPRSDLALTLATGVLFARTHGWYAPFLRCVRWEDIFWVPLYKGVFSRRLPAGSCGIAARKRAGNCCW